MALETRMEAMSLDEDATNLETMRMRLYFAESRVTELEAENRDLKAVCFSVPCWIG